MRAVNLIPEELRPRVPGDGDPRIAYGVLGGLAVLLVMVLLAISYSNKLHTIEDQTAAIQAETQTHRSKAATFATSPDQLASDVKNRTLLVGGLAKARFPWGEALGDLSRSIPADTTLDNITASSGTGGSSSGGSSGPSPSTLALTGCTAGWVSYSRFMTWLKLLPGVAKVESSASAVAMATQGEDKDSQRKKNCGPAPLTFSLTVTYRPRTLDLIGLPKPDGGSSGATGAAPAGVPAASSTPAPAAAPPGAATGGQ